MISEELMLSYNVKQNQASSFSTADGNLTLTTNLQTAWVVKIWYSLMGSSSLQLLLDSSPIVPQTLPSLPQRPSCILKTLKTQNCLGSLHHFEPLSGRPVLFCFHWKIHNLRVFPRTFHSSVLSKLEIVLVSELKAEGNSWLDLWFWSGFIWKIV